MNRNYKVVWNQALGCFTAVAEYAKSRGKSSSSSVTSNASINIESTTSSKEKWRLSALGAGLAGLTLGLSPSVMAEVGVSGGTGGGTAISNCSDVRQANSGSNTENIAVGCSSSTDHTGLFIADRGNPYYTDNATNAALVDAADRNAYTPRGEEGGSVAIGTGAKTEIALGLAIGEYAKTTKIAGIALGVGSLSTGNTALALGRQSTATADYAQAIGNVAAATGKGSLAVGHSATATGYRAIAIGATDINQATASFGQSGANYQAVGQTKATADDTIAFGSGSQATATNALAFGAFSEANKTGSVALGNGSRTNENTTSETTLQVGQTTYAVAGSVLDTGGNLKEGAQVSVGSRGSERQIKNVAGGRIAGDSTDAVNGSQLHAVNNELNKGFNISAQGGADDNVQLGETVDFTNTDGNLVVNNTDNKINYNLAENIAVTQLTTGNTVINNDGVTLTGGTNRTVILSNNGLNNGGNTITNVAAGVNPTDAANVSQLGSAAAASRTEVTAGTNVASVTQSTGANGQAIYTVNANGTTASAGSDALTVTTSTPDANNVTDYQFDLSNDTKNSLVKADNSVQYDNADQTSVTLGGTGATAPVTLTNVANGDLSATSTDAVNGSQLFETNENVGANTNNITTNANNIASNTTNITNAQTKINQGFNLTADNGDEDNVQLGEAVNFTNTDGNLIATVSDNGINYDLADVISVGTDNTIAINGNAGTISGLTNTTFDGDTVYTGGQAATQEQLSAVNAATNNNLNQGLNFTGDNTTVVVNRKFGQTLTIKGGATDLTENNIGVVADANGDLNVQLAKDLTGLNSATFGDVVISTSGLDNGGNKITNVADGSVTAGSKDAVNGGQLNQAIETVNTSITQAKTTVTEGDNIVVTQSTNADGSTDYKVETARDLEVDSVKAGDSTLDDNGLTIAGGPSVTKEGINAAGNKITNVADGTEASDAVNFGQLQNSVADANKGFNISAQGGNTTTVGNGGAVDFNSKDNNIIVSKSAENNDVSFELNRDLNVNSVTATSVTTGNTTTNNGGVTITGGSNQTVALTNQGLNNGGNRVTGVAAGIDATDAVNVGQLNGFGTTINSSINDLGYRIDDVEDDANAGVSAAMAMSSIPQSFLPGKSMVGGGIATYNGESAVAIGVSRVSDNGRWVLKVNGTADTQGNAGGAVGAGFHF